MTDRAAHSIAVCQPGRSINWFLGGSDLLPALRDDACTGTRAHGSSMTHCMRHPFPSAYAPARARHADRSRA